MSEEMKEIIEDNNQLFVGHWSCFVVHLSFVNCTYMYHQITSNEVLFETV